MAHPHTISVAEKHLAHAIIEEVASSFGVDSSEVMGLSKRDIFSRPRIASYRRLHDELRLSFQQIALIFGRDRSAIHYGYYRRSRVDTSAYTSHFRDGRSRYTIRAAGYSSECWIWNGSCGPDGYAKWRHEDKTQVAHRVLYEANMGAIPEGLELDHLCRNRSCVNPAHLEPVTPKENTRRRDVNYAAIRQIDKLRETDAGLNADVVMLERALAA